MAGTLYTYPENFRAYKALIAAQFSGAKVTVASDFVFGQTNKSEAFLKKFPLGKVPAFETADGKFLTESNAIAYYVSNEQLRGKTDLEKAEVLSFLSLADNELLPAVHGWVFAFMGIIQFQKNNVERAKQDLKATLTALNSRLVNQTFLVGERLTLADIVVFATLLSAYEKVLDPSFRAPFGSLTRWFNTVLNQPQVKAVVKGFTMCAKVAEIDPKKFAEFQAKTGGAQQQQQKEPKEKKEKKPAPAKKEKEAEPAEELDAAELALAEEPKSKDPFDAMPKGTFNFDDFKRCYSNEDEAKSIPYFFEKFDPEHYSIWYGEYKYPEELTKVFMSCNLITGMFQRLDKMRKQAFSSVCLFGEDNNSTISGVWVWRGQDLAFELSPDWQVDYEVYDWKKLDPKSEETKKLVTQYFSWSGTDSKGRKFNQGKIFK
ncbi:elongation factor 1-gamma [Culex quinquefasciatus]|uniref:Elongation factor 1-gamma n=1 Tax=Culex quinquefasciatus TaxID=7176 RepID=B0X828_CULQU|nr:elongation factor 1-gamma [Culex quinquefasciatus]|eukprot:XP_001865800.1 elongation factor 1-gamma [Culex quinquefasciatus]